MTLQRRFGYGLLAAAVGNLALAVGGRLSGAMETLYVLVLVNFAVTLGVLAALQVAGVADFEFERGHRRAVSTITACLFAGGVLLTVTGALLWVDWFAS